MQIRVLSDSQIGQIQSATEDILEKTGFKVEDERLLKIAARAGAMVEQDSQIVKIPRELLRSLLGQTPSSYVIKCIDGKAYTVGGGDQYISAIVTDPWIINYDTGKPRRPSLNDVVTNTVLTQLNDKVAQVSRMDFPVTEYEDATSSLRALEAHLLNHAKHYSVYAGSVAGFRQWLQIGELVAPAGGLKGSALMSVAVAVVSPLILSSVNAELLLGATGNRFAVIPTICPMAGTTSPYSKAATLLQGNVENIFLAALTQMVSPGNPFLYAFGPSVSNMHSGRCLYYTLDKVLWKAATTELARAYNLPVVAECGGTLSHRYDMQSGAESMLFMLTAQNTGSDLLAGLGSCYNANGLSSEMIVIHSAWLEAAEHLSRGIGFEDFQDGIESIMTQCQGGHFLMDDLTLKLIRSNEFFASKIFDMTGGYEAAPSMLERAHERVVELTADYVSPVPGDIQEALKRYFHDQYTKLQ
jgi:trimethylamine--corrinoid protein Co-methyltransferase